jgi:hypothetical protein
MLAKCANPGCSNHFLYWHEGKLFRYERRSQSSPNSASKGVSPERRVEFFWLCSNCAASMTLVNREGAGIDVQPLDRDRKRAAA